MAINHLHSSSDVHHRRVGHRCAGRSLVYIETAVLYQTRTAGAVGVVYVNIVT
jgi:hypothetical protein